MTVHKIKIVKIVSTVATTNQNIFKISSVLDTEKTKYLQLALLL